MEELKVTHSLEIQQLRIEMKEMSACQQIILTEKESAIAVNERLATENILLKRRLTQKEKSNQSNLKLFEEEIKKERGRYLEQLKSNIQECEEKLREERRINEENIQKVHERMEEYHSEAMVEKSTLESQIQGLKVEITHYEEMMKAKDEILSTKLAETEAKISSLEQKDASISALNAELEKVREYLVAKKQPLQANIMWRPCASLPFKMDSGQSTVINGLVYYGGGLASAGKDCCVYCYHPHQDQWTTLPQLSVKRFGLGQIVGRPVVVGGLRKDNSTSNEVSIFFADERFFKWKKYTPMPTARSFPTVVSYQSYLIVAGGMVDGEYVHAVEILSLAHQQWLICESLPMPCYNMSAVVIQEKCYLLGGFNNDGTLNHVFYATVSDLLRSCFSYTVSLSSAWKSLPETPTYGPTATVIAGSLFILGGDESCTQTATQERIHVYSPSSNSWVYVNDLPAPRIEATATALSPTEILLIGGRENKDVGTVNTVYKGIVQIAT